uniref:Uncharacterized protein n=1 Tax=Picea sitchensis TaxID=3332 RepID=D5ABT7_PICSI|nr:unknown [Picea sitchensis]
MTRRRRTEHAELAGVVICFLLSIGTAAKMQVSDRFEGTCCQETLRRLPKHFFLVWNTGIPEDPVDPHEIDPNYNGSDTDMRDDDDDESNEEDTVNDNDDDHNDDDQDNDDDLVVGSS